jgi:uncharacterized membrane protein
MNSTSDIPSQDKPKKSGPGHFFLRGLAISLPPILTLVIIFWVFKMVNDYAIVPIGTAVRYSIAVFIEDTVPYNSVKQFPKEQLPLLNFCGRDYLLSVEFENKLRSERLENGNGQQQEAGKKLDQPEKKTTELNSTEKLSGEVQDKEKPAPLSNRPEKSLLAEPVSLQLIEANLDQVYVQFGGKAVPYNDYHEVASRIGLNNMPKSATGLYMELAMSRYFQGLFHLTAVMVLLTIVIVYFLGRLVTARLGQWFVSMLESKILGKVPVVSNVYGSVKQVTDFIFSERQGEYSRVVAIEYPRRGIWALGLVTSDSMMEITAAAGEPLVTVLIPSSPMPVTGYTMSLPRKEVLDLDITVDQAFQFCISCGVLIPEYQKVTPERIQEELARRLAGDGPVLPVRHSATDTTGFSQQYDSQPSTSFQIPDKNEPVVDPEKPDSVEEKDKENPDQDEM